MQLELHMCDMLQGWQMWNIGTGIDPDNPSPQRCFMSITLVASKTRQINAVDSPFIPSLQIQENMHNVSVKYKYKSYIKFSLCFLM